MNFTQEQVEKWRNIVSIEGMLWTYGKTGNAKLLDICERAYNGGKFGDLTPAVAAGDERFVMHGVTCMEELKLPMLLYAYTGKRYYLDLALNAERKLTRDHMLPDGVPASAEALVGNGGRHQQSRNLRHFRLHLDTGAISPDHGRSPVG